MSSDVSPNLVEPDSYIIDAETNVVWNSWAVTFPATVKSPDISALPFISKLAATISPAKVAEVLLPLPSRNISVPKWENWIPSPTEEWSVIVAKVPVEDILTLWLNISIFLTYKVLKSKEFVVPKS